MQPDQDAAQWDRHVAGYEAVFEHLSTQFAAHALRLLAPLHGTPLLDVAAGAGGAALLAAQMGAHVTAIDASHAMVARMSERGLDARIMDGQALDLPDRTFDRALSCFGIVLFPDPAQGMAELHRVLRPGGRVAIVTWTEPHRYELAARLRDAILAVRGAVPQGELPAQLRFIDPARLHALLADAGFQDITIERHGAMLEAPSAQDLVAALDFAPGMAAMLAGLGPDRATVLHHLTKGLPPGPIALGAVAHIAIGTKPSGDHA